ncbi:MAG: CHAD domain-containing protein [Bacteroidota bacterium]|jgi:CHAD domain-containing protein/transposase|nr:CHAD domain-containing protein [Bacteroidota bacterium]
MTMLLDDLQRARILALAEDTAADDERRRNARILLAYDDGGDTREIATAVGLSESRVRYWRGVFRKYGMTMFDTDFAPPVHRRPAAERAAADHPFVLPEADRAALERRAADETDEQVRIRITLLLAYADGAQTDEIARMVGLSPSRTRYWRRTYERVGLRMFDADETARPRPTTRHPRRDASVAVDADAKSPEMPGILPEDSSSEAGRKVLRMYFEEFLRREAQPDIDTDPEIVHKMRVATRRLRSTFEIFDGAFEPRSIRKFRKPLRQLGRVLGYVRDLDVLLMHMRGYAATLRTDDAASFAPLLAAWEEERMVLFAALRAHLETPAYLAFRESFRKFVDTPGAGAVPDPEIIPGVPRRIAHIAPELMLRRYTDVLAFEPFIERASIDLLHRLRMQCKKLRYTMECFTELLGPGGRKAIRQVVVLQDYLGELQDGQAASDMITDFVSGLDVRQSSRPLHERLNPAPLLQYLATREAHKHALLLGVAVAWNEFRTLDLRKRLLRALLP